MKKLNEFLKMVFLVIIMIVLSACELKTEYGMKIHNNKSVDFTMIVSMDEELLNGLISMEGNATEITEEEKWDLIEKAFNSESEEGTPQSQGFAVERYESEGFKGYKYTKKIKKIDDITGDNIDFDFNNSTKIENLNFFVKDGQVYKTKLSLEELDTSENLEMGFSAKFVVTLPSKPISHNADEVSKDGKTLTWNIIGDSKKDVEFEFKFHHYFIYFILLLFMVAVGGVIYYVINKRKGPQRQTEGVTTLFDNMNGNHIDNIKRPEEKEEILDTIIEKNTSGILNPGEVVNNNNFEVLTDKDPEPVVPNLNENIINKPITNSQINEQIMQNKPMTNPQINEQIMQNKQLQNKDEDNFNNNRFFAQPELKPKRNDEPAVTVESMFPTESAGFENINQQVNSENGNFVSSASAGFNDEQKKN